MSFYVFYYHLTTEKERNIYNNDNNLTKQKTKLNNKEK